MDIIWYNLYLFANAVHVHGKVDHSADQECYNYTDFQNEILYSYYLQSLQRLSTRVCKYFRPESLQGLSNWVSV